VLLLLLLPLLLLQRLLLLQAPFTPAFCSSLRE
jgi:hypothetical protein